MIDKNVLLIGAGNMGSAIGKALFSSYIISSEHFFVADKWEKNLAYFSDKNCRVSFHAEELLPQADIVILATKPQVLRELLSEWRKKNLFKKNVILLSIAAGISVHDIQTASGIAEVVRVMPNTPLLVGKGVSGYFISSALINQKELVQYIEQIIQCFGLAIACDTEEKINAITALSGSGPAYFFRLLEAMQEQGEQFGFSSEQATSIALHTLLGSGLLAEKALEQNADTFTSLREKVTSKGGTTEAALQFFTENKLSEIFQEGMQVAKQRAEEL